MDEDTRSVSAHVALRLAVTLGILWGGAMFVMGVVTTYTTWYAQEMVRVFGSLYYGYGPTWGGAVAGLAWGFLDVFIGTLIAVAIYNLLGRCRRKKPE